MTTFSHILTATALTLICHVAAAADVNLSSKGNAAKNGLSPANRRREEAIGDLRDLKPKVLLHFSRQGQPVPFGRIAGKVVAYMFGKGMQSAHADGLEIACDPSRKLESVELRATCSEAVIGLAGLTAVRARD